MSVAGPRTNKTMGLYEVLFAFDEILWVYSVADLNVIC